MNDLNYIVGDLQRRLANMIRRGRVHSVDFEQVPPRVKVDYDQGAVTGWLPWISGRESNQHRTDWEPLAIGEQVIILSESGELSAGVVLPSLPDATSPVPSTSPDEHVSRYEDGTTFIYNRITHTLSIDVQGDANVHTTGNLNAQVDGSAHVEVAKATTVKTEATLHVESAKNLNIKTRTDMVLEASGNIDITAGGNVNVMGSRVDLN